jgi:hypothetical protein
VIADLIKAGTSPEEIIGRLYVRSLSRKPTETETKHMAELIAGHTTDRKAYEDVLWALLNSTEFAFNH